MNAKFQPVDPANLPVGSDEVIGTLPKQTTHQVRTKTPQVGKVLWPDAVRKHPLAECEKCPLYPVHGFVPTDGPQTAVVAVVSRSAGKHDVSHGRPFTGPSGAILDALLVHGSGGTVQRKDVLVTNTVLCQAEKVSKAAIDACKPRLMKELEGAKNLILCGAEAAEAIIGRKSVFDLRGIKHSLAPNRTATVTFNPAFALRNEQIYPSLQQDFRRAFRDPRQFREPTVYWANTIEGANNLTARIMEYLRLSVDIEATSLSPLAKLVSIGFSDSATEAFVFGRRIVQSADGMELIRTILERPDNACTYLWHGGQYDVGVLRSSGVAARIDDDTLLLSYATDERSGVHSLEYLVRNNLDWPDYEPDEVKLGKAHGFGMLPMRSFTRKKKKYTMRRPFESWGDLYRYNGFDACGPVALYDDLVAEAKGDATHDMYRKLLIPGANMLADVERFGVRFDVDKAREVGETIITPEIERLVVKAREIVGKDFNLNSPPQVGKILYDDFRLKDPRVSQVVRSTDAPTIEKLLLSPGLTSTQKSFLGVLSEHRKVEKLRNTYVEKLPRLVSPDGRLRANFNLHTTETGRLSGSKPNLQNQPRGPLVRQCYIASEGNRIVSADYSQAELRTVSILANDDNLQQIYHDGRSLHAEVATKFFGEGYDKEQYTIAKNINFGIIYQQSAKGFAEMYHMREAEAQRYINGVFELFPDVKKWINTNNHLSTEQQYLRSVFGRVRRFHLVTDKNRREIQRQGVNFLVQGPASDFTLWSAIEFNKIHPQTIIILVHDSIVLDVPALQVMQYATDLKRIMESAPRELLGWEQIPFLVDVSIGENWGYVTEVDMAVAA